jgi:hypothetical protein
VLTAAVGYRWPQRRTNGARDVRERDRELRARVAPYTVAVTLLLVKLTLAPLLVVASSLAARRWGPRFAGLLVALPIVAGPVLLIVDLEQGAHFAARAASAALLGLVAFAAFAVVFANVSRVGRWAPALLAGWGSFVALALALSRLELAAAGAFVVALLAFAIAAALMPRDREATARRRQTLPPWDLPARALATVALVVALTGAARGLGPTLTGVLTPFPVAMSVLAAFVLAQDGPRGAHSLLRGFLRGAAGFACFFLVVAVLVIPAGTALAFVSALAAAVAAQLLARSLARSTPLRARALAR